jgi:hypothetical protein
MTEEEKENWENCQYRMKEEGFHYCFTSYSSFTNIKDEEFHRLRMAYLDSAKALEKYINDKVKED